MLRTLRGRLFLVTLLPLLVGAIAILFLSVRAIDGELKRRTEAQLQTQVTAIGTEFETQITTRLSKGGQGKPLVTLTTQIQNATGGRLYYAPYGDVQTPDIEVDQSLQRIPDAQISWSALEGKRHIQTIQHFRPDATGRTFFAVARPVYLRALPGATVDETDPLGALVLARPRSDLSIRSTLLAQRIAPAVLVGAAIAIVLALIGTYSVSGPLRRLVRATREVGEGGSPAPLETERRDEFGVINRSIEDMVAKLRESQEHERQFLLRISHELRTPLTAVRGNVEMLLDGILETDADRSTAYGILAEETGRLSRLIEDLLTLQKLDAGRFELEWGRLDLAALVQHAVELHRPAAAAREIEPTIPRLDPVEILGDGDRIVQVLSNLVANAVAWAPRGGSVRVSAAVEGERVRVEVADSGPGIPADKREQVMSPFFSERAQGTGLGLAIAHELATRMGGDLVIGDAPEGGALFTLVLPRSPRAAGASAIATADRPRVLRRA
jgi:two-component system OmpR family sensor kinase